MIDNIKFNFTFKPDENWLTKLKENIKLKKEWESEKGKAFRGILFLNNKNSVIENLDDENSDDENSDDEKSDDEKSDDEKSDDEKSDDKKSDDKKPKNIKRKIPFLRIGIILTDSGAKVEIENSLRKWFFDTRIIGDFNKNQFVECLNILSKKLIVDPEILFGAKVTRVEYGGNLSFRKEFRCFYSCIHSHIDIKKKCTYGDETIEFKGENRSVIFYDKITEQKGKSFSAMFQKKLNNVTFLLRYEIKVKKMSGAPEKPFMDHLSKIIENWATIVYLWEQELDKITFTNSMNPKIYEYLKDAKIKPITQYLVYLGMEHLGLDDWRLILSDRMYSKIRKNTMDSQLKIYNDFKSKIEEESFEYMFKSKVIEKGGKLRA